MMLKHFFLFLCLFGSLSLAAQIKPVVIYSGEYCVETPAATPLYFSPCGNDVNKGKKHFFELVLLENNEFWIVQNNRYTAHKDSLQFVTGRWKIDNQNYVLEMDSTPKRFSHFKKVSYRPDYFKRPFFKLPGHTPNLEVKTYELVASFTHPDIINHTSFYTYSKNCLCAYSLSQSLSFSTKVKSLPLQFFFDSAILAEIPRTLYELKD